MNTLAIMNTAFNLYLNALSTGLYISPLYAGFFNGLERPQQKIIGLSMIAAKELDMSIRKALELIQVAKSYQCILYWDPPDRIRLASQSLIPDELLNEVKAHKPVLIEYFKHTDRDLTPLLGRAFDGYLYCLNQMRECHSSASASDCHVSTLYWRSTVKATLQVSNPELKLIEMLLIQSEQLKYLDSSNTALITPEQEQQKYSTDKDAGTAFNYLLSKHRQFVRC